MIFLNLYTILGRKVYLAKINKLTNHHGAGPPEARGPMQMHRLYRLKAGPGCGLCLALFTLYYQCRVSCMDVVWVLRQKLWIDFAGLVVHWFNIYLMQSVCKNIRLIIIESAMNLSCYWILMQKTKFDINDINMEFIYPEKRILKPTNKQELLYPNHKTFTNWTIAKFWMWLLEDRSAETRHRLRFSARSGGSTNPVSK